MGTKIFGANRGIATSQVISDNTAVALDIESTDAKDYIVLNTTNNSEQILLRQPTVITDSLGPGGNVAEAGTGADTLIIDSSQDGGLSIVGQPNDPMRFHFVADDYDYRSGILAKAKGSGGGASTRYMNFYTGGQGRMLLNQTGLGIGTTTPDALLHVQDTAISTTRPTFNAGTVAIFENDTNCSIQILTKDTGSSIAEINMGGTGEDQEGNLRYITSEQKMEVGPRNAGSKMGFYTAGTQRVHIDASGKTAVGASTPKHLLHVQDGDLGVVTNSADDVAKSLVFTKSKNNTDGGHTVVDDDTVLGNIVFEGSDSTGAFEPGAKIRAQVAAGTIGDGRIPTELIFSTAPDSASAPLDALVVNPSGFLEVQSPTNGARLHFMDGATERAGLKAFSGGLYVDTADSAHDIFFRPGGSTTSLCIDAGNTFVGILDVTPTKALDVKNGESGGDILCYDIYTHDGGVTSSDERMKENIVETTLGLDFINTLNPVSYKWKDTDEYTEMRTVPATDGEPEHEEVANTFGAVQYTRTHHGLIAQQVNQAVTDAGLTATEFAGYTYDQERDQHGLRYQEFISPLIKAVQELTARIAVLEAGD